MSSYASRIAWGERFSLEELESLKTISTGQADDLKINDGLWRVWLSRCTIDDGEPYNNKVTVEYCYNGCWLTEQEYPATGENTE